MAEEVTLTSDLIKMGIPVAGALLGAAIGGVSSYVVSQRGVVREKEIKESHEFRAFLHNIAVRFAEYEDSSYKYLAFVINEKIDPSKNHLVEEEVVNGYVGSLSAYRFCRATLRTLGLYEADDILSKCMDITKKVFVSHKKLKRVELDDYYDQLKTYCSLFYKEISQYFDIYKGGVVTGKRP